MKKVLAMLLASSMILAFAACGGNNEETTTGKPAETTTGSTVETTTGANEETTTEAPAETTTAGNIETPVADKTALEFFNEIWAKYQADTTIDEMNKLPSLSCTDPVFQEAFQKKMEELSNKADATDAEWEALYASVEGAGVLTLTEDNKNYLEGIGFPVNSMNLVDSAATGANGMMANFFTVTVSHIADSANVSAFADAYKAAFPETHFLCGQPEGYSVITVGDYVVAIFGVSDLTAPFISVITGNYDNATVTATGTFF